MLERELKRLGVLEKVTFDSVARLLNFDKLDDFLAAIGAGDVTGSQITNRVLEDERRKAAESVSEEELLKPRVRPRSASVAKGVSIMGAGGLLVNLGRCCSPMAGDDIIGYITRGRGVTVHRTDCPNMVAMRENERLIDVSWGGEEDEQRYLVPVEVVAYDREGLLREISTIIAEENVNIASVEVNTRQHIATLNLQLEIASNQQLTRILSKIDLVSNVVEARRRNTS